MMGIFRKSYSSFVSSWMWQQKGGEDVEMESLFSRLTLHVIGKAVFSYDFDSSSNDTGIVEVRFKCVLLLNQSKS
jgi:beta-ring hydroxylase